MSFDGDIDLCPPPPPASQSHFAKFENFTPDDDAPFDDEFARLASSQQWIPGSQQYKLERTVAMREELELHYFPQKGAAPDEPPRKLTEQEILEGYQSLCNEVHIPPRDTIVGCKRDLKKQLVNIIDLIDARRRNKVVVVWEDFDAFRKYTLGDEKKRINTKAAKEGEGFLASLLQNFQAPRGRMGRQRGGRGGKAGRGRRKDGSGSGSGPGPGVSSAGVTKKSSKTVRVKREAT